jgi:hypothetical protein
MRAKKWDGKQKKSVVIRRARPTVLFYVSAKVEKLVQCKHSFFILLPGCNASTRWADCLVCYLEKIRFPTALIASKQGKLSRKERSHVSGAWYIHLCTFRK